jgi:hypothetical protein
MHFKSVHFVSADCIQLARERNQWSGCEHKMNRRVPQTVHLDQPYRCHLNKGEARAWNRYLSISHDLFHPHAATRLQCCDSSASC